ncbi:hypothetical protein [Actinocatenispora rupis]|uniref:Uncharacterized protein n=1 Tax=Actinocatenispora rupis TaxID=519421 RepID=A0A8J3N8D7_9ACTN|nr:hypothetical protein [Actinocatenispora rupis]GID10204.1 hypothetical protein Aru02nite_10930 [Actinocatenispora rupis]
MSNRDHTTSGCSESGSDGDQRCMVLALRHLYQQIPCDAVPRIGTTTTPTPGEVVSEQLPVPDRAWFLERSPRFGRILNTVLPHPGGSTTREVLLNGLSGRLLGWWLAVGYADRARLVIATDLSGTWYDALPAADAAAMQVQVYRPGTAPTGRDEVVELLQELARPGSRRRQTAQDWAAAETRMCTCWHRFDDHHLDDLGHPCRRGGCDCRRFASLDTHAGPGRWVPDRPSTLAALGPDGRCQDTAHHTGPDGRRWHWAPTYLTHHTH